MPAIIEIAKNNSKRTTGLVLMLFFFIPMGVVDIINGLLIVFLLHSIFTLNIEDWKKAFKNKAFWMVGGFFVLHILSVFRAEDAGQGLIQLEIKAPFFLAALLVVANQRFYKKHIKENALKLFLYGTVSVSVISLLISTVNALREGAWFFTSQAGNKILFFTYVELAAPLMHPGYYSTFVGFAIFISLGRLFSLKGKSKKIEISIFIFLLIMMILLQGRINIIALFAVFGLGGVFYAVKNKMYKLLAIPATIVILLVVVLVFGSNKSNNRFLQMPDFSYDITGDEFNSATYRLAEWTCAADVIAENFWLGVGVGDNRKALIDAYKKRGFKKGVEYKFNAHNQYLETMLATGVLGLAYLLFMLFTYGKWALKQQDYTALACLVFLAIGLLTESMFERSWAISLFAIFFPFMIVAHIKKS